MVKTEKYNIGICNRNVVLYSTDLKLHLQTTDYGNFLANEAGPLTVAIIDERLREKLVVEFEHIRNQAVEPLATFLDFITYVAVFLYHHLCII